MNDHAWQYVQCDSYFELLLLHSAQPPPCDEVENQRFLVSVKRLQGSFMIDLLAGFPLIRWCSPSDEVFGKDAHAARRNR